MQPTDKPALRRISSTDLHSFATPLSNVLDELARLRMKVACDDRTAILDSIRLIDRELRTIDRAARAVARRAEWAIVTGDEAATTTALRETFRLFAPSDLPNAPARES